MATTATDPKRKRSNATIDLTGDSTDDDAPAPKTQRVAPQTATQNGEHSANATAHQTAPASSAPSASQRYRPFASSGTADSQHSQAEREAWLATNVDADDLDEVMSGTQDAAENDQLQLYGDLPTKIVGVQYYRGIANAGEYILMRREPGNPYDKNAIRIDNVVGQQIGHIPKRIAEKLSKYMDKGWMCCEGRLSGVIGPYDCPLEINMFGPDPQSEAGRQLAAKMVADKLPVKALKDAEKRDKERLLKAEMDRKKRQQEENKKLAEARRAAAAAGKGGRVPSSSQPQGWLSQSQSQPGPSSQPVMEDLLEASQRFNPRSLNQATDQYGMQEEALQNMPLATKPASIKTDMLPYQLQALQWLLEQEDPQPPPRGSPDSVQLWKRHEREDNAFTNLATTHPCQGLPTFASGGILADDMGLGKTLEMISLLVADAEKNGRGTTLIVAPLS
ncbi:hypothetical protein LTR08_002099 [Meristemomyces frigidus]|nr:hypothetical protein LTR08_002099 [Meristemomyces frigidus]